MENLSLHYKLVIVSYAFMDLVDGILRVSRNYAVNKSAINATCLLEPCLEALTEVPEVDVLIDALLEFLTIKEDQFTWKNNESLAPVAIEMVISVI